MYLRHFPLLFTLHSLVSSHSTDCQPPIYWSLSNTLQYPQVLCPVPSPMQAGSNPNRIDSNPSLPVPRRRGSAQTSRSRGVPLCCSRNSRNRPWRRSCWGCSRFIIQLEWCPSWLRYRDYCGQCRHRWRLLGPVRWYWDKNIQPWSMHSDAKYFLFWGLWCAGCRSQVSN